MIESVGGEDVAVLFKYQVSVHAWQTSSEAPIESAIKARTGESTYLIKFRPFQFPLIHVFHPIPILIHIPVRSSRGESILSIFP